MPDRLKRARQHRLLPTQRHPRVPLGEGIVRENEWLTSDHMQSYWYRVTKHSSDWSQVVLQVAVTPDAPPTEIAVTVRRNGSVLLERTYIDLGAEAIRIIATAIRARQRNE